MLVKQCDLTIWSGCSSTEFLYSLAVHWWHYPTVLTLPLHVLWSLAPVSSLLILLMLWTSELSCLWCIHAVAAQCLYNPDQCLVSAALWCVVRQSGGRGWIIHRHSHGRTHAHTHTHWSCGWKPRLELGNRIVSVWEWRVMKWASRAIRGREEPRKEGRGLTDNLQDQNNPSPFSLAMTPLLRYTHFRIKGVASFGTSYSADNFYL